MMRIRALNAESSEESEGEEDIPTVTKEAQEHACFTSYNEALNLLRDSKYDEASAILQELLESSTLAEITKPDKADSRYHQPVFMLKYSCLKNLGNILIKKGELKQAIDYLLQAANLDGTDVTLWYQIGCAAIKTVDYVLAVDSFLEGLRFSPRHWPCLDNVITVLYVSYDFLTCLHYISRSLTLDPGYTKGLAFRDKILKDHPSLTETFKACYPDANLGDSDLEYDKEEADEFIQEALDMKGKQREVFKHLWEPDKLPPVGLRQPLKAKSWLAFGEALTQLYAFMYNNHVSFASPIDLNLVQLVKESEVKPSTEEVMEVDEQREGDDTKEKKPSPLEDGEAPVETLKETPGNSQPEDEGDGEDSKNRKRRTSFIEQWMWGGKRRSARVRSTVRKDAEDNLEQALRQLVPEALLPSNKSKDPNSLKLSEDSQDTMELYKLFKESDAGNSTNLSDGEHIASLVREQGYFGTEKEEADVDKFLSESSDYIGDILLEYTKALCDKRELAWPAGLPRVFLEACGRMRRHHPHPSAFDPAESDEWLRCDAMLTVLHGELLLDGFLQGDVRTAGEVSTTGLDTKDSKTTKPEQKLDFPCDDLGQMMYVTGRLELPVSYMMRIYWLKAHVMLQMKAVDVAINDLDGLLYFIEEEKEPPEVRLVNCRHNSVITAETAGKLLTSLTRNKSLCEVVRLYESESYEELVPVLQETLRSAQPQQQMALGHGEQVVPDRHSQLAMLMDSLHRLKQYQECFYWGEACVHEAFHKYLSAEDADQPQWARTVEKLLAGLQTCIEKEGLMIIDSLKNGRLARLIQNLINMVCNQLEAPETLVVMPVESVAPWVMLQQILQRYEDTNLKPISPKNGEEDELPVSIRVLATGHDFLARRSWCCSNEGAFLLHVIDVLIPRIHDPNLHSMREQLNQILEQAFFCLYAHPTKKTKGRTTFLQEHGVPQIPLTWSRAAQLYRFYEPEVMPSFDGSTPGIVSDAEPLFKRIMSLVPPNCDPVTVVAEMNNYIDSMTDLIPTLATPFPPEMIDLYYLLADYYFKNSESALAIQHYLLDVCVNGGRLDSWSGMALARGSQLDVKLNSCDIIKSESDFLKRASRTQRCYKRALQIDPMHQTLWIEYGSFAYMIHSFCGRLLKQTSSPILHLLALNLIKESDSLSMEMFNILDAQKEDMLTTAINCFTTASKEYEEEEVQDELWLHHYMLGKAAEKTDSNCPDGYLSQYERCVEHLHKNGAVYPSRISYSNPQNLAVEALEIYYRIHASILKYLEIRECTGIDKSVRELFERHIQKATEGPFIMGGKDSEESKKRAGGDLEDEYETKRPRILSDGELIEDVVEAIEELVSKSAPSEKQEEKAKSPVSAKSTSPKVLAVIELSEDSCDAKCTPKPDVDVKRDTKPADGVPSDAEVEIIDEPMPRTETAVETTTTADDKKKMEVLDLVMDVVKEEDEEEDSLQLTPEQICDIIGVPVIEKNGEQEQQPLDMEVDEEMPLQTDKVGDETSVKTEKTIGDVSTKKEVIGDGIKEKMITENASVSETSTSVEDKGMEIDSPSLLIVVRDHTVNSTSSDLDSKEKDVLRYPYAQPKERCFSANSFEENFQKFISESQSMAMGELEVCERTTATTEEAVDAVVLSDDGQPAVARFLDETDGTIREEVMLAAPPREADTKEEGPEKGLESRDGDDATSEEREGAKKAAGKEELMDVRRSSQESTTTTTSTTGGTTSGTSSSDDDTTSSDSSDSSSSSDESDSSKSEQDTDTVVDAAVVKAEREVKEEVEAEAEVEAEVKVKPAPKPKEDLVKDNSDLAEKCLRAMEECIIRFPTHYKAMYRLGHYFFRSKQHRDVAKCRDVLLGSYRCRQTEWRVGEVVVQGLFSDRKKSNFFNGVWRIPNQEIDRPGSFASHMSRCMQLLMEVLTEDRDQALLLELCIQLRKIPDPDKKYLLDSEREQLARQALSLCLKAVRAKMAQGVNATLVLDVYKAYQRVQKHFPQKEKMFANLLQDAYRQHQKLKGPVLEQAVKFCQMQIAAIKAAAVPVIVPLALPPVPAASTPTASQPSVPQQQQQPQLKTLPVHARQPGVQPQARPRSRGRPPNQPRVNVPGTAFEYPRAAGRGASKQNATTAQQYQYASMLAQNMANMGNLNYYPMHSLFDMSNLNMMANVAAMGGAAGMNMANLNMANINAANLNMGKLSGSNLTNSQILDQQLAALNMLNYQMQMGNYQQELLRHYGSSIAAGSPMTTAAGQKPQAGGAKAGAASAKLASASGIMKDRPGISITPVAKQPAKVSPEKALPPPQTLQQKLLASQVTGKNTPAKASSYPSNSSLGQPSNASNRSRSPQTIARIAAAQLAELSKDKPRSQSSGKSQHGYSASNKNKSAPSYGSFPKNDAVSISPISSQVSPNAKSDNSKQLNYRKAKTDSVNPVPRSQSVPQKPPNLPNFGPGISVTGLSSGITVSKMQNVDAKSQSYSSSQYGGSGGSKGSGYGYKQQASQGGTSGGYSSQTATGGPTPISLPHGLKMFPKPAHGGDGQKAAPKPQNLSAKSSSSSSSQPTPVQPLTLEKMVFPTGIDPKLQKIGREITVTPTIPRANSPSAASAAAMVTLNRLQSSQGNQLEIIPKPLDLAVPFPKGITITKTPSAQLKTSGDPSKEPSKKPVDPFEIITLE